MLTLVSLTHAIACRFSKKLNCQKQLKNQWKQKFESFHASEVVEAWGPRMPCPNTSKTRLKIQTIQMWRKLKLTKLWVLLKCWHLYWTEDQFVGRSFCIKDFGFLQRTGAWMRFSRAHPHFNFMYDFYANSNRIHMKQKMKMKWMKYDCVPKFWTFLQNFWTTSRMGIRMRKNLLKQNKRMQLDISTLACKNFCTIWLYTKWEFEFAENFWTFVPGGR